MATSSIRINGLATPAETLIIGNVVTLTNASNSGAATWAWVLLSKPFGSAATIATPTASTATFTADKEGTYLIQLTVNGTLLSTAVGRILATHTGFQLLGRDEIEEGDATGNERWARPSRDSALLLDKRIGLASRKTVKYTGANTTGPKLLKVTGSATLLNGDVVPTVGLAATGSGYGALVFFDKSVALTTNDVISAVDSGFTDAFANPDTFVLESHVFMSSTPGALTKTQISDSAILVGYCSAVSGGNVRIWFSPGQETSINPGITDVKDYGATGDGTTNDTDAINVAITAAIANGSRHIHFSPGTYRVDRAAIALSGGAFTVPSNFLITGCGQASTIKQTGVVGTAFAYEFTVFQLIAGTKNVTFQDLWFLGENGVGAAGFVYNQNNQAECIGTTATNDITDITVRNCTFDNLWGFSIHSQGLAERFHVIGCTTRYCANGINVNSSHSQQIFNIIVNSEGFECTGDSICLGWNNMQSILGGGISLGGDTTPDTYRRGCTVVGNTINGGTGLGIFLSDAMVEAQVVGNSVRDVSLAGFQTDITGAVGGLGARNFGNIFTGNSSINNGSGPTKVGIALSGEGKHTAIGNYCSDDGAGSQVTGIYSSSPNNTIIGNYCSGTGTNADIQLTTGSTSTFLHGNRLGNSGKIELLGAASISPVAHQGTEAGADLVETSKYAQYLWPFFGRTLKGEMSWGPGDVGPFDTNLYRSAPNVLKTDDTFIALNISKVSVVHNVADYGAVGDNSTDDTAAIQAAITASMSDGLPVILVPGKTYKTTAELLVGGVVRIKGGGKFVGGIRCVTAARSVLAVVSGTLHVSDLQIYAERTVSVGIYIDSASLSLIERVHIYQPIVDGIQITNSDSCRIIDTVAELCGKTFCTANYAGNSPANIKVTVTGTVSGTAGISSVITGVGTSFLSLGIRQGDFISLHATGAGSSTATFLPIESVDSNTQITCIGSPGGTSPGFAAGSDYSVHVGDGYHEGPSRADNNNHMIDGWTSRNIAGCGIHIHGLYGPKVSNAQCDASGAYPIAVATRGVVTIGVKFDRCYFELNNAADNFFLGYASDIIIDSVNGTGDPVVSNPGFVWGIIRGMQDAVDPGRVDPLGANERDYVPSMVLASGAYSRGLLSSQNYAQNGAGVGGLTMKDNLSSAWAAISGVEAGGADANAVGFDYNTAFDVAAAATKYLARWRNNGSTKASVGFDGTVTAANIPVSVKALGAVGNGVADDTVAIQAALSAAGHVYIPEGTYLVSNRIDVFSDTRLTLHPRATIKRSVTTPPQTQLIRLSHVQRVIVEGGVIDGNKQSALPGVGGACQGIALAGGNDITIRDIEIKNFPEDETDPGTGDQHGSYGDGIYLGSGGDLSYCQRIRLSNIYSHGHERHGLFIVAAKDVVVENCVFADTTGNEPGTAVNLETGDAGILSAEAMQNIIFRNCIMTTSYGGLTSNNHSTAYWHDILFENCTFRNNANFGAATGGAGLPLNNFRFVNCVFENNGTNGIQSGGSVGIKLLNCRSEGNGGAGIELFEPRDFTVQNCSINNNLFSGITIRKDVDEPLLGTIDGCSIFNNGSNGIGVSSSVVGGTGLVGLHVTNCKTGNSTLLQQRPWTAGRNVIPDVRVQHGGNVYECIVAGTPNTVTLGFKSQVANFSDGLLITGTTSGATGTLISHTDAGTIGVLQLGVVTGTFLDNEQITDAATGSATVDGVQSSPGPSGTGADITDGTAHWKYVGAVQVQENGIDIYGESARGCVLTRNFDYGNALFHVHEWPSGDANALDTADIIGTQWDGQFGSPLTRSRSVAAEDKTGTPGPVGIRFCAGKATIATGTSSTVVTSALCKAVDIVMITPMSLDATLTGWMVTLADGSFTVTGNTTATANWDFSFEIIKYGVIPNDL